MKLISPMFRTACLAALLVCRLHAVGSAAGIGAAVGLLDQNATFKIMPLGDSITEGREGGYRYPLQDLLLESGYSFDFVGSRSFPLDYVHDPDHEGHSGWEINYLPCHEAFGPYTCAQWKELQPDLILLMMGTNDMHNNVDLVRAPKRLGALIDQLFADCPHAHLIVAQITPFADAADEERAKVFNAALALQVQERAAHGVAVSLVNMHDALAVGDLADGTHPNATGYAKMAAEWLKGIKRITGNGTRPNKAPPIIALDGLKSGDVLTAPLDLTLSATVGDAEGQVKQVEFTATNTYSNAIIRQVVPRRPYRVTLAKLPPGPYNIVAKATDNFGAVSTSFARIKVKSLSVTAGSGTGLRAEQFEQENFGGAGRVSLAARLDWEAPANGKPFSMRWSGQVQPFYSEIYRFNARLEQGGAVWVDNRLVFQRLTGKPDVVTPLALEGGRKYDIRVELPSSGYYAQAHLFWVSPSQELELVPTSRLYPAGN